MDDTDEEKLFFLLGSTTVLTSDACQKLRSYLKIHSSIVADRLKAQLPANWTNKNNNCQYCCTSWTDGNYNLKVLPIKHGKKLKKLLRKKETFGLSLIEKKLLSLAHHNENVHKLVINCLICHKSTHFIIKKRAKGKQLNNNVETVTKKKKKKRKKLDKSAGLILTPSNDSSSLVVGAENNESGDSDIDIVEIAISENTKQSTPMIMKPVDAKSSKASPGTKESAQKKTNMQPGVSIGGQNNTASPFKSSTLPLGMGRKPKSCPANFIPLQKKGKMLLNPYSTPAASSKKGQLQKLLMAEKEKNKSPKGTFKDFLSLL